MIQWLKHLWFNGPAHLETDDFRGVLYIYRIYLIGYALAIANLGFGHLGMPPSVLPAFYIVGTLLLLVLAFGGYLLYRQAWKAATILLFSFIWLLINGIALFFRGVQDPIIALHIPILIGVGYYFNFKQSFAVLILDLLVLSGITFAHEANLVEGVPASMFSQSSDLFFWCITFLTAGGIIFLSTQRAEDTKADIEAKNQVLAEQRAALEVNKSDLEREVSERTKQLEWAKNRAEKASNAKSTFLAKMSHELRTPLNIIIGYSEMIQESLEDEAYEGEIIDDNARIHSAGKHLLKIIDNILELSKIEEGGWQVHIEPINVVKLMSEVAFLAEPLMIKQNNDFEIAWGHEHGKPISSLFILADKQMLKQVFINLLSNAAKFTHNGRIVIQIDGSTNIGDADSNKTATFIVSDTGKGIDSAFMDQLFKPFQQEEESFARSHEGTGLGLAISKEMIEQMGGSISAENNATGGASFTVTLPISAAPRNKLAA
ncbi:MAG: sensor histidine kinase [Anaerolineae bacterium]